MENCTIYRHSIDFNKLIEIQNPACQKAVIDTGNIGLEKKLRGTIKGGLFSKSSYL